MKTSMTAVIAFLLFTAGFLGQRAPDIESLRKDMFAILTGDMERFERGMTTLEGLLANSPNDPGLRVLWGSGLFARSGDSFSKGDIAGAMKFWQSGLAEMAKAVEMAPDNPFVRGRRGVILINASRQAPPEMAAPLLAAAVSDFEKVLQIREAENSFSSNSTHKRGELLLSLGDGWSRMGDRNKARGYFERITRELQGTTYEEKAKVWLDDKPEGNPLVISRAPAAMSNSV